MTRKRKPRKPSALFIHIDQGMPLKFYIDVKDPTARLKDFKKLRTWLDKAIEFAEGEK